MSKLIGASGDAPRPPGLVGSDIARWPLWPRLVAALGLLCALSPVATSAADRISGSAARQIQALMIDKATRTPAERKVSSHLLYALKRERRDPLFNLVPRLRTTVKPDRRGAVLVDIKADVTPALLQHIEKLGGNVVNSVPRFRAIRANLPLKQVVRLAGRPDVISVRPGGEPIVYKIDTSEGDVAHAAAAARATFGVDGSGVKIGVLSDSVDLLATLQASGDLPAGVTVLAGQSGNPGTSEGTAMLEIVFDLAPGAQLYFASAVASEAQFAQNILDLRVAGCDVIVDDVFWPPEPAFQDGIIAQAVNTVTADGALYFASAGNAGNLNDGTSGVWEGNYNATTLPAVAGLAGVDAHDFGGGASNQIMVDSDVGFILKWSDPHGTSANDYDLCILDSALSMVDFCATDVQDGMGGNDYPYEEIPSGDGFEDQFMRLVVVRKTGGAATRFIHLNALGGQLAIGTAGQTSGHNSAVNAFGVAAVDVNTASGSAFTGGPSNPVETFSSDGPRQVFYQADGTAITPGNFLAGGGAVRQKPDVAAADRVLTATRGTFVGTSAAAPHAAAIAALLLERAPGLDTAQVRGIFQSTALDIEAAGIDRDSGAGIIMADDVLNAVIFVDGFESGNTSVWSATVP